MVSWSMCQIAYNQLFSVVTCVCVCVCVWERERESNNWLHAEESLLKANSSSASQKIAVIVRNPNFHDRLHNSCRIAPVPHPINPVHNPHPIYLRYVVIQSFYLLLYLSSGLFTSGFPTKTLQVLLHTCHMFHPFRSSRFYDTNNI
jgi:hypothetical protein